MSLISVHFPGHLPNHSLFQLSSLQFHLFHLTSFPQSVLLTISPVSALSPDLFPSVRTPDHLSSFSSFTWPLSLSPYSWPSLQFHLFHLTSFPQSVLLTISPVSAHSPDLFPSVRTPDHLSSFSSFTWPLSLSPYSWPSLQFQLFHLTSFPQSVLLTISPVSSLSSDLFPSVRTPDHLSSFSSFTWPLSLSPYSWPSLSSTWPLYPQSVHLTISPVSAHSPDLFTHSPYTWPSLQFQLIHLVISSITGHSSNPLPNLSFLLTWLSLSPNQLLPGVPLVPSINRARGPYWGQAFIA